MQAAPVCHFCARGTFDPDKRERAWARGVVDGGLVLVCPSCQAERAGWADALDACEDCGETRLHIMLGQIVCRACGHSKGA